MAEGAVATSRADHTRVEVPRGPAPFLLRLLAVVVDVVVVAAPAVAGALIVHSLRAVNVSRMRELSVAAQRYQAVLAVIADGVDLVARLVRD